MILLTIRSQRLRQTQLTLAILTADWGEFNLVRTRLVAVLQVLPLSTASAPYQQGQGQLLRLFLRNLLRCRDEAGDLFLMYHQSKAKEEHTDHRGDSVGCKAS